MEFRLEHGRLSDEEFRRQMRKNQVTIRELSRRTGITMKRIREVRQDGLRDRNVIRDWLQTVLGSDPGPL